MNNSTEFDLGKYIDDYGCIILSDNESINDKKCIKVIALRDENCASIEPVMPCIRQNAIRAEERYSIEICSEANKRFDSLIPTLKPLVDPPFEQDILTSFVSAFLGSYFGFESAPMKQELLCGVLTTENVLDNSEKLSYSQEIPILKVEFPNQEVFVAVPDLNADAIGFLMQVEAIEEETRETFVLNQRSPSSSKKLSDLMQTTLDFAEVVGGLAGPLASTGTGLLKLVAGLNSVSIPELFSDMEDFISQAFTDEVLRSAEADVEAFRGRFHEEMLILDELDKKKASLVKRIEEKTVPLLDSAVDTSSGNLLNTYRQLLSIWQSTSYGKNNETERYLNALGTCTYQILLATQTMVVLRAQLYKYYHDEDNNVAKQSAKELYDGAVTAYEVRTRPDGFLRDFKSVTSEYLNFFWNNSNVGDDRIVPYNAQPPYGRLGTGNYERGLKKHIAWWWGDNIFHFRSYIFDRTKHGYSKKPRDNKNNAFTMQQGKDSHEVVGRTHGHGVAPLVEELKAQYYTVDNYRKMADESRKSAMKLKKAFEADVRKMG